jgi:hypothetical protein
MVSLGIRWLCYVEVPGKSKSKGTFIIRACIQKFPYWVDNEINNNNKHSLRSNTKGYGAKTH